MDKVLAHLISAMNQLNGLASIAGSQAMCNLMLARIDSIRTELMRARIIAEDECPHTTES